MSLSFYPIVVVGILSLGKVPSCYRVVANLLPLVFLGVPSLAMVFLPVFMHPLLLLFLSWLLVFFIYFVYYFYYICC